MKTQKTFILIFLATIFILSSKITKAQFPIDTATGKVKYTAVINFTGKTKDSLYDKAKLWVTSTLKSGDNMNQFDDVNKNKIVASGTVIIDSLRLPYFGKTYSKNAYINFKFILLIKDGKIKYSIENILLYYSNSIGTGVIETGLEDIKPGASNWTKGMKSDFKKYVYESINKKFTYIILDFTKSMNKKEDNNW